MPEDALERGRAWLRRLVQQRGATPRARSYAAWVLARAGAIDLPALRYLHDSVITGRELALVDGQLGAALSLLGDRSRAHAAFAAIDKLPLLTEHIDFRYNYFTDDYYGSPLRDWAALLATAAEAKQTSLVARLFERYQWVDEDTDQLTTQEKAWLLIAAHALTAQRAPLSLAVNGTAVNAARDPVSLAPDAAALAAGYSVRNLADREVWQTVSVHGIPKKPLPAAARGVTLTRQFWTLQGKAADLDQVRQNDRLIVTLKGDLEDDRRHEVALLDLLPAGFEIEGVVPTDKDGGTPYRWLGKHPAPRFRETRDDRFVAAFVFHPDQDGNDRADSNDASDSNDGDNDGDNPNSSSDNSGDAMTGAAAAALDNADFVVVYIVRAVTPGSYVLPAATAQDMYRPAIAARTPMGSVTVLPRQAP